MTHKKIKNGKYPQYSFRLDPALVEELEKLKGSESWNALLKKLLEKYGKG